MFIPNSILNKKLKSSPRAKMDDAVRKDELDNKSAYAGFKGFKASKDINFVNYVKK